MGVEYNTGHVFAVSRVPRIKSGVHWTEYSPPLPALWLWQRDIKMSAYVLFEMRSKQPPRPSQPPSLSGMENEYQPKCDDALSWKVKARSTCGLNVLLSSGTAWSLSNTWHTWAPQVWVSYI